MQASKKTIDRAIDNGSLPAIDRLISAAHLLTEIADYLTEEGDDLARKNNLMLGEVKRAQRAYSMCHSRYYALWTDLVNESHMSHERTEDFDHFLPYIARLLSIDDVTTDTNTGKMVRDVYDERYASKGGLREADKPAKKMLTFRLMHGDDAEIPMTYRHAKLTEEQKDALGEDVNVTFRCHAKLNALITAYAEKEGTTRRDILNEALLTYMQANGIADKTN